MKRAGCIDLLFIKLLVLIVRNAIKQHKYNFLSQKKYKMSLALHYFHSGHHLKFKKTVILDKWPLFKKRNIGDDIHCNYGLC